ncbi:hypothetical protein ACFL08_01710 [Patescibacteria group bacterium]
MLSIAVQILENFRFSTSVAYGITFEICGEEDILIKLSEDVVKEGSFNKVSFSANSKILLQENTHNFYEIYAIAADHANSNKLRVIEDDYTSLK